MVSPPATLCLLPLLSHISSQHSSFPSREGTKQGQDCWEQPTNTEHMCVQTPQSRGGSSEPQCRELHDGCGRAAAPSPQGWGFPLAKKTFRLF